AAGELPVSAPPVDLFVAIADRGADAARRAFGLAFKARRAGLAAQLELAGRSLKGQLKQADRIRARYVAIVAEHEQVTLKNMESGEQDEIALAAAIPTILRGSRLS
ncbi:MAG: His/Gly/Thr/Pro-type tRNA ligase C-terminal domain-containing protein, partial [Actinomycetota bacterium]|nr:His/Gly/Thr/Pro-type tRNA ligase C-terminal domain-containing protein [Actinomycetota bacterium]